MSWKKQIKYAIMVAIALCISFIIMGNTNVDAKGKASTKGKVVKVTVTEKTKNDMFYGIIKGVDKKGQTVWKYQTPSESAAELSRVMHKTKGKYVYVVTASTFFKLKKSNGKVVCNVQNEFLGGSSSLTVQKNGTFYVSAYYDNTLVKFASNGKVIWADYFNSTNYFWPYKVELKKKNLIIWFDNANDYDYEKMPHKMVISKKNGDILSGKY